MVILFINNTTASHYTKTTSYQCNQSSKRQPTTTPSPQTMRVVSVLDYDPLGTPLTRSSMGFYATSSPVLAMRNRTTCFNTMVGPMMVGPMMVTPRVFGRSSPRPYKAVLTRSLGLSVEMYIRCIASVLVSLSLSWMDFYRVLPVCFI
jgi:hypothetical protein